jgi:hypothetical protein
MDWPADAVSLATRLLSFKPSSSYSAVAALPTIKMLTVDFMKKHIKLRL